MLNYLEIWAIRNIKANLLLNGKFEKMVQLKLNKANSARRKELRQNKISTVPP